MRLSLGTKLTAAFVVLGLLPLVVLGMLAQYYVSYTHRQDISAMETQLLRQQSAEVTRFLQDTAGIFDVKVGYTEFLSISSKDQESLLEDMLTANKNVLEVALIDANGKETSKLSQLQDMTHVEKMDVSNLPSFKEAKAGRVYFGPLQYTKEGPLMTIAGPVTNKNGEVVMVVSGLINLDPLVTAIGRSSLGTTNYVYAIDSSGTVFASANPKLLNKNIGSWSWTKQVLASRQFDGLGGMVEQRGIMGEQVLASALPMQNLGWALVAEWPKEDAFRTVRNIQAQVVLFSTIVILLAALLGWLAGRWILKPLKMLQAGAIRIGQGHFDHKIGLHTHDEMEELGDVFNRMGRDLERLEELKAAEVRAEALAESLRKEQQVSRIKEQLIKNSSHQLRTPLSIVRWNSDLLNHATNFDEEKELKQNLGAGIEQLGAIVSDLVTVSDLGFEYKNTLHMQVDVKNLLDQITKKHQKDIAAKKLTWDVRSSGAVPPVFCNSVYMTAVFENLLDNALTYTKENGAVTIDVTADAEKVHIKISDNGIGIPDKDKDLLFTQFFRAENAIDMKNVGTGLGLYICKTIIEGHGGSIHLDSQLGSGTTVCVDLPFGSK